MTEVQPTIQTLLTELKRAHDRIDAMENELRNYEQELRTHSHLESARIGNALPEYVHHTHEYSIPGLPAGVSVRTSNPK